MPPPVPPRDRTVYFVGAGLSSAFGLPNTPALITETLRFAKTARGQWLTSEELEPKLSRAFRFFYPDATHPGFQPDVVDFFSSLRTYLDVGVGLAGTGFADARELYRLLRRGIAYLLFDSTREIDSERFRNHPYLQEIVQPGRIVITSNWDPLFEHFARLNDIPLRLTAAAGRKLPEAEFTLLKLHGSIDWCQGENRNLGYGDDNFAALGERQFGNRPYRLSLPSTPEAVIRVRTESVGTGWQRVKSRAREPYLVTMVTGKADDLGPLQEIWRDAYRALSRAARLEIVGYSMPPDDVEIRTILRTGIQRGAKVPKLLVRNPSPDVHQRVRSYLDRHAESSYVPIPGC